MTRERRDHSLTGWIFRLVVLWTSVSRLQARPFTEVTKINLTKVLETNEPFTEVAKINFTEVLEANTTFTKDSTKNLPLTPLPLPLPLTLLPLTPLPLPLPLTLLPLPLPLPLPLTLLPIPEPQKTDQDQPPDVTITLFAISGTLAGLLSISFTLWCLLTYWPSLRRLLGLDEASWEEQGEGQMPAVPSSCTTTTLHHIRTAAYQLLVVLASPRTDSGALSMKVIAYKGCALAVICALYLSATLGLTTWMGEASLVRILRDLLGMPTDYTPNQPTDYPAIRGRRGADFDQGPIIYNLTDQELLDSELSSPTEQHHSPNSVVKMVQLLAYALRSNDTISYISEQEATDLIVENALPVLLATVLLIAVMTWLATCLSACKVSNQIFVPVNMDKDSSRRDRAITTATTISYGDGSFGWLWSDCGPFKTWFHKLSGSRPLAREPDQPPSDTPSALQSSLDDHERAVDEAADLEVEAIDGNKKRGAIDRLDMIVLEARPNILG
jgi:hypothetical protein